MVRAHDDVRERTHREHLRPACRRGSCRPAGSGSSLPSSRQHDVRRGRPDRCPRDVPRRRGNDLTRERHAVGGFVRRRTGPGVIRLSSFSHTVFVTHRADSAYWAPRPSAASRESSPSSVSRSGKRIPAWLAARTTAHSCSCARHANQRSASSAERTPPPETRHRSTISPAGGASDRRCCSRSATAPLLLNTLIPYGHHDPCRLNLSS